MARFFAEEIAESRISSIFNRVFGVNPYNISGSYCYPDRYTYLFTEGVGSGRLDNYNSTIQHTFRNLGDGDAASKFEQLCIAVKSKFCKEPGEGYVKSYLSNQSTMFWRIRRPTSSLTVEVGGKYLEANCGEFVKVFTAIDRSSHVWRMPGALTEDYVGISTSDDSPYSYYLKSILTPIHHTEAQIDGTRRVMARVAKYDTPERAEQLYQKQMLDGVEVYVNIMKPEAAYFAKDVMNYSTRIETVVPEAHLFQKGQTDLYKGRDKATTPFLGWELEACGESENARKFKEMMTFDLICKSDSSIQPAGFEIVSVPATLDFWKESNLSQTLDTLRSAPHNMRSFKHSSCGFHVHVSRAALSVLDLNKIERFVHNPANNEFMVAIAGRGPNTYQNYYPDMFEKRKDIGASRRGVPSSLTSPLNFGYLDTYIADAGGAKAKGALNFMWDYISLPSGPVWDAIYRSVVNRMPPEDAMAVVKSQLETSGLDHPSIERIKQVLKYVYPEEYGDNARGSSDPRWANFKALCKSAAPSNRKDSASAAQMVKGPVGKAAKGRYDVLNTKNTNTVEFRLFKGTMNPDSVFRYLEFVDALVRYVHVAGATNNSVGHESFCKWLVSDAFNIARYEKLVAFLVSKEYIDRKLIRRRELNFNFETSNDG